MIFAISKPMIPCVVTYALLFFLIAACTQSPQHDRTGKASAGSYGEEFSDTFTASLGEMQKSIREQGLFQGLVSGRVLEVCTKKGCWMTMELPNKDTMRVTFSRYAFFVPSDLVGKRVLVKGDAQAHTVGIDRQRHYARDAGRSDAEIASIQKEKEQIVFEAVGVKRID